MNAYIEGARGPSPWRAFLLVLLSGSVLASPSSLSAQTPDTLRQDTVYEIEPIAVRAVRPTATTGGVSAITVRLDSVRFRPAPLLEDVLRELPLVQVRTNSRGEAQLALRGAEERQIAILLDGIPVTLGWDHRTDLSVIPMTGAQKIDLVRGMSSVLHGPNVLGGVVEIAMGSVPVVNTEPLTVSAGIDQQGGYSVGVLSAWEVRGDAGRLTVRGGIGRRERDGFAAAKDVEGVYQGLVDDDQRVNSDLDHTDGFLSARYSPRGPAWLSATVSGFQASRGVPPELNEDGPRLWRYPDVSRVVTILAGGFDAVQNDLGFAKLEVNVGIDMGSTLIEDYLNPTWPESSTAPTAEDFFTTIDETESSDDRTLTFRLQGEQGIGATVVRASASLADIDHDEVITVGIADGSPQEVPGQYRQRLWSLAAETEIPFHAGIGMLNGGRLSAGLAYDGAQVPEPGPDVTGEGPTMSEWAGRVGISTTTSGGGLLVHTALSRRGRFPALREMYSTALGRFHPNPNLKPEILTGIEAGFTSRFGRYDLQVVGFHQRLDDAIVRGAPPADSDARYMRINRDQIRSTGLEILAGYSVGRIALEGEATIQSVEVVEPGQPGVRAEYEPEFAGGIGGTAPLFAGIEVGAEIEYWSEQFCATPSPGQESYATLDPSTRTDIQFARTFRLRDAVATFQRLGVELAIDNAMDSAVYDQCGLPQPGRTIRLQVRLN